MGSHSQAQVRRRDTLLLRRTYPELESSLLAYFRRDVPRELYKSYNESKHLVTWTNGSTTRFGYCRNENDVYQYQGAEFLFIGIDELTHFTLKQWQFLTSRNRCPVPGSVSTWPARPTPATSATPGSKRCGWITAAPRIRAAGSVRRARLRLHSRVAQRQPDLRQRRGVPQALESLPEHLRRAFLEGDWNVFAGQYFDIFDFGRHTARPEEFRLEPWWPRWISIDWGFQHPSAVYWHCAMPVHSRQVDS